MNFVPFWFFEKSFFFKLGWSDHPTQRSPWLPDFLSTSQVLVLKACITISSFTWCLTWTICFLALEINFLSILTSVLSQHGSTYLIPFVKMVSLCIYYVDASQFNVIPFTLIFFCFLLCLFVFVFRWAIFKEPLSGQHHGYFYLHLLLTVLQVSFSLQVCNHFDVIIEPSTQFLWMPASSFLNKTSFKNGPLYIMYSWHHYWKSILDISYSMQCFVDNECLVVFLYLIFCSTSLWNFMLIC